MPSVTTTDEKKAKLIAALGEPIPEHDWQAIIRLAAVAAAASPRYRATADSAELDARTKDVEAAKLDAEAAEIEAKAAAYEPTIGTSLTDRNAHEHLRAEAGSKRSQAAQHRERAAAAAAKARRARASSDRARAQLAALQQGRLLVGGDDQVDGELLATAGRDVVERLAAAGRTLDA